MKKLFEDIRTIARSAINQLHERIEDSLEKLYDQVKPEEKIPSKRPAKSDSEPTKRPKTEEPKQPRPKTEEPKQPKPKLEDSKPKLEEIKENKPKAEETKESKPKIEETPEIKSKKPKSEPSDEEEDKSSCSEDLGLDSEESSSQKSDTEEEGIKSLPKTKENLMKVIKMLDSPADQLEEILHFLLAVIEGSDAELKERVKHINIEKKFGSLKLDKDDLKNKVKKIVRFIRPTPKQTDHLKDLELLKKKLESAIGRKNDQEILDMFRRFEDKLKEKLGAKENQMMDEVWKVLIGLTKNSKNSEVKKLAKELADKIQGKFEGTTRKGN